MQEIVIEPTQTAQWHTLVSEAEAAAQLHLDETCESYLVFLLMRFTNRPEMAGSILGLEFLDSLQKTGNANHENLRDVGDKCLLYSGLFPQQARKRLVRIGYFVALGKSAYHHLQSNAHHQMAELYGQLVNAFVPMMDVLQAIRDLNNDNVNLDALSALELWQDSQSQQAYKTLHTQIETATPIITNTATDAGDIKH